MFYCIPLAGSLRVQKRHKTNQIWNDPGCRASWATLEIHGLVIHTEVHLIMAEKRVRWNLEEDKGEDWQKKKKNIQRKHDLGFVTEDSNMLGV